MSDPHAFRAALGQKFVITCEQIPGRLSRGEKLDDILAFAEWGRSSGTVDALSLTDNPGGSPACSPDILAAEIEKTGMPVIVHLTAKDMNRNAIESRALALDRLGVTNLLMMSGDYPVAGQSGVPKPVFDVDPVHILAVFALMNRGLVLDPETRTAVPGPRTDFFPGAVMSPFKPTEPGAVFQRYKLEKKLLAGARFIVTQFGYDVSMLREFAFWLGECGIGVPVLGSVFILRRGSARAIARGEIPGAHLTPGLLEAVETETDAEDKGRAAALERTAMQVAVLRGLGFAGAHLEALTLTTSMVETIVYRSRELAGEWEECAARLSWAPSAGVAVPDAPPPGSPGPRDLRRGWAVFRVMEVLHGLLFVRQGGLSRLMQGVSRVLDRSRIAGGLGHAAERAAKSVLFDCRDCGDCALPELQYLCPMSQCPKQQRNGPCGGSHFDACEVHPDRPCVWHRVYVRAKAAGALDDLRRTIIGPCDWRLEGTSSWVNFHLGRDHAGYDFPAVAGMEEEK